MNKASEKFYRVREFAGKSGVTIRTLHHYDHLGLLKPSHHSESGYRLYAERDFARLQQIVTLKFIGFSLKQIKEFLDGEMYDLAEQLWLQRTALEQKRRGLELAIQAIGTAERIIASGAEPDSQTYETIIRVINMENNKEWMRNYYTDEQLAELKRRSVDEADEIRDTQAEWAALIAEVEGALNEDPAGPRGRELAARWSGLVRRFTKGDPELAASVRKLYNDEANWPSHFQKPYSDAVGEFINAAMAAHGEPG